MSLDSVARSLERKTTNVLKHDLRRRRLGGENACVEILHAHVGLLVDRRLEGGRAARHRLDEIQIQLQVLVQRLADKQLEEERVGEGAARPQQLLGVERGVAAERDLERVEIRHRLVAQQRAEALHQHRLSHAALQIGAAS